MLIDKLEKIDNKIQRFDERVKFLSEPYKSLVFIKENDYGLILLIASFLETSTGLFGIISLFICNYLSRLSGIGKDDPLRKVAQYNCILTGFAAGYLLGLSLISIPAAAVSAVVSFFLTRLAGRIIENKGGSSNLLLNIPFTLTVSLLYVVFFNIIGVEQAVSTEAARYHFDFLPAFADGFARTFGLFVFLPYDLPGAILLFCFLVTAPFAFLHAAGSFYAGVFLLSALSGFAPPDYFNIMNINFILAGLYLHSCLVCTAQKKYLIILSALAVCVLASDAVYAVWQSYKIPLFTLPFIISVLLVRYFLYRVKPASKAAGLSENAA